MCRGFAASARSGLQGPFLRHSTVLAVEKSQTSKRGGLRLRPESLAQMPSGYGLLVEGQHLGQEDRGGQPFLSGGQCPGVCLTVPLNPQVRACGRGREWGGAEQSGSWHSGL